MGSRLTWALLALVAIAGALLWIDAESRTLVTAVLTGTPPEPEDEEFVPLLGFEPDDVRGIDLVTGDVHVVLRRDGEGWGPAPATFVQYFLRNLTRVGRVAVIEAEGDDELSEFGLAPASRQVVLLFAGDTARVAIDIGKPNPPGTAVYTRIDGAGPVLIAGSVLIWEFDRLLERLDAAG